LNELLLPVCIDSSPSFFYCVPFSLERLAKKYCYCYYYGYIIIVSRKWLSCQVDVMICGAETLPLQENINNISI
jgi:hypothetical protein